MEKSILEMKKEATLAKHKFFRSIKIAVDFLEECKKNGENVYIIFHGQTLYSCDISLDKAFLQITGLTKAEFDDYHSELYTTTDKQAVEDKYDTIKQKHIQEEKQNAILLPESEFYLTKNLDDVVKILENYKQKGISVYCIYSGHRLYSADISIDSAYLQVTGFTKAEIKEWDIKIANASTPTEQAALRHEYSKISKRRLLEQEIKTLKLQQDELETEITSKEDEIEQLKSKQDQLKEEIASKENEVSLDEH